MQSRARVYSFIPCRSVDPRSLLGILLSLFLALPGLVLASCGGAGGEDAGGTPSPVDEPNDDEEPGPGGGDEEEPPPDLEDLEGFGVWPGSEPSTAPGGRLGGFVGYRNSPRLARMTSNTVAAGSRYRRTWFAHEPSTGQFLGEDFAMAATEDYRLWLHVVGTPSDLSPHPELTENEYGTGLPGFARYLPTDPVEWTNRVLAFINMLETEHGVVPEYLELWNEVERPEWYVGTLEELLAFYTTVSKRVRLLRPELKVGGPALAGYSSTLGGTESVILAYIRNADATNAPLDFVSWHHYAPANELLFSDMANVARDLADSLGLPPIEAIVSEWNIAPSAEGAMGPEFDGSHAAANLAGFLATAYERQLDGNLFFLDVDEDNDPGITDLAGVSLGALTLHGVKKPVFHALGAVHDMMEEDILPIYRPEQDEFNLQVLASRSGDRTRILVSNDVVTGTWMFANRARQFGMEPGWLYDLWLAAGGAQAELEDLIAEGLTQQQAEDLLGFLPEVYAYAERAVEPRDAVITVLGTEDFHVSQVIRFDEENNAPAALVAGLMPELEAAEEDAVWEAAVAVSAFLETWSLFYTAAELNAVPEALFMTWADAEGIPYGIAVSALKLMRDTHRDERLASANFLNNQPETQIQALSAGAAGVAVDGRKLRFQLAPDTLLVIEIQH